MSTNERVFTLEDQQAFAQISGDYNPLHLDPIVARRLMYGKPVVHGIHGVLWALDMWLTKHSKPIELRSVKVDFFAPIAVLEPVQCQFLIDEKDKLKIRIDVNGSKAASVQVSYSTELSLGQCDEIINRYFPEKDECKSNPPDLFSTMTGKVKLHLDSVLCKRLFPSLECLLPSVQLSEILATTRIVGMECPGLNSIFSGMSLKFFDCPSSLSSVKFHVSDFDERFSRLLIAIEGPCASGELSVFCRPPQKTQPSYRELINFVEKNRFEGQRAIVIGGSRGLGEVTAKLLAAGGAETRITYFRGQQDAHSLVDEINLGGGKAASIEFDVLSPPAGLEGLLGEQWTPTHLYYFATPFIFEGVRGKFSASLFDKFCDYYVTGFVNSVQAYKDIGSRLEKVFYPSSVAVQELPIDMIEYASAKAAGEVVCAALDKSEKQTDIVFSRLPRLDTDQTASLWEVENLDPVPFLLKIICQL